MGHAFLEICTRSYKFIMRMPRHISESAHIFVAFFHSTIRSGGVRPPGPHSRIGASTLLPLRSQGTLKVAPPQHFAILF